MTKPFLTFLLASIACLALGLYALLCATPEPNLGFALLQGSISGAAYALVLYEPSTKPEKVIG